MRIAHRGAAALEPQNTLLSIEAALRFGVEMVEIDVRRCRDGTLVVVHDDNLRQLTGVNCLVSKSTYAQLRQLDMGKGERIPTLEEALDLLRGRALVNIDQKLDAVAPELLAVIDRAGCREETMLSGHAPQTFRAMRKRAPTITISWSIDESWLDLSHWLLMSLVSRVTRSTTERLIRSVNAHALMLHWRLAIPSVVAQCQRMGLKVFVWTVDDLASMRKLKEAGVDGITSNRPDLLLHI